MSNLNDTTILDSREEIGKLDKANILGSVEALADQVRHAWEDTQALDFSLKGEIRNVVVAGMGGSGLGPDVFKHLFVDQLKVPFSIYNGYELPAYTDQHTLVILSSYSGSTEEVLNCAEQVKQTGAQAMVISSGGKLGEVAEKEGYPYYHIDPKYNPSNQPRMAIGYAVAGLMGLMNKAGLIELPTKDIEEAVTTIIRTAETLDLEAPQEKNQAKLLAFQLVERRPILVASEFLVGVVHVAANQFNESAKMFADYKVVPELNHHLMEGLRFPKNNDHTHYFVFFQSKLYDPRNQKRMSLTQQVVEKNHIETLEILMQSPTKLTQAFELMTLMSYTNFYVSMLEGIDPGPVPFVDWFKEELGK